MANKLFVITLSVLFLIFFTSYAFANDVEIAGVKFPTSRIIEGKTLQLNGVSVLKKFGFVKVYAVGLYLENLTQDPEEIIKSEQVKYIHTQYLTDKATKEKIREGFIEFITKCNSKELVDTNKVNIDQFVLWLDSDMAPGLTSETIYVPGEGITLIYKGETKGTISSKAFSQMYYEYNIGNKADRTIRNGLLGIKDSKE